MKGMQRYICVLLCAAFLLVSTGCGQSVPTLSGDQEQTCNLDTNGTRQLQVTLMQAELCKDLSTLAKHSENWNSVDIGKAQLVEADGQLNPLLLHGGSNPIELLLVKQQYENRSNEPITLSLLSNQVDGLNRKSHRPITELSWPEHAAAVYLELSDPTLQVDDDKDFWLVRLPAGKTVTITIGYAVPTSLKDAEIQYTFKPYGDTNYKTAVDQVRFLL